MSDSQQDFGDSRSANPNSELQQLFAQLVEGTITDEEFQTLGKLLAGNPAAREQYREYVELHAMLQFEHQPQAPVLPDVDALFIDTLLPAIDLKAPAAREGNSSFGSGWFSLGFWALTVVLGIAAAEAWLLYRSRGEADQGARREMSQIGKPTSRAAAFLTLANGCDWGDISADALTVGKSVQMGDEITLYEGIAEFRLASGVSLSIEGPTTLVMTSINSLFLQHGRLTAYVPWAASDFRLITSACRLTASDAEFGVHASGGEVDIHAFSGEVLAVSQFEDSHDAGGVPVEREPSLASGSEFVATTIAAGRGLTLVSSKNVTRVSRWHSAIKDHFATKLTMAGPLPITRQYVDSVMESRPISYWRFESQHEELIPNEIPGAAALKIFGDLRLVGESTNRQVELGRPGSNGYLLSEDALTFPTTADYSLEVWLKPSHHHSGTPVVLLADLAKDGKERAAFLLQMLGSKRDPAIKEKHPGKIRFLHRNPPGPNASTGTSCFSSSTYTARRWQHVVATKHANEMRLYIDGALVATASDKSPLANNLHVVIGQLGKSQRLLPFVGQMDELAIYDRALSQDEISKRLKILKWKPDLRPAQRNDF